MLTLVSILILLIFALLGAILCKKTALYGLPHEYKKFSCSQGEPNLVTFEEYTEEKNPGDIRYYTTSELKPGWDSVSQRWYWVPLEVKEKWNYDLEYFWGPFFSGLLVVAGIWLACWIANFSKRHFKT